MKKYAAIIWVMICIVALTDCCNRNMNYIIQNEPNITGIVKSINNDSFLMENETGEYWVSLHVENKDSMIHFSIGDEVVVYFDGNVAESYPMQINTVYAITLKTPADRSAEELRDLIPMVMVNGKLYYDTGRESTVSARCGMMDGEITSTVDANEAPSNDNQSNFGTGYGYQYGVTEGSIELYINGKWWVFETATIQFHNKTLNKSSLSKETLEWLEWYNDLTETEQLSISYIPSDLYELCGYPAQEDAVAEETGMP